MPLVMSPHRLSAAKDKRVETRMITLTTWARDQMMTYPGLAIPEPMNKKQRPSRVLVDMLKFESQWDAVHNP